jgi:hypothetical protein
LTCQETTSEDGNPSFIPQCPNNPTSNQTDFRNTYHITSFRRAERERRPRRRLDTANLFDVESKNARQMFRWRMGSRK